MKTDCDLIRESLTTHRTITHQHRWGGWFNHYEQAKAALEALDRVQTEVEARQMPLPIIGVSDDLNIQRP